MIYLFALSEVTMSLFDEYGRFTGIQEQLMDGLQNGTILTNWTAEEVAALIEEGMSHAEINFAPGYEWQTMHLLGRLIYSQRKGVAYAISICQRLFPQRGLVDVVEGWTTGSLLAYGHGNEDTGARFWPKKDKSRP